MGSLKTLVIAGAVALGAVASGAGTAAAADYYRGAPQPQPHLPPPPPPEPLGLKGTLGSGLYLRGDIGVGVVNIDKYEQDEVRDAGGTFYGNSNGDTVFGGAGVGWRFNNWFRVDGTLEYRSRTNFTTSDQVFNPFANITQTNTYRGNLSSLVALFNAYVDLGTWNCLTPYLGAGIGYATNRIDGLTDQGIVGISPTLATSGNADKSGVAWALMAGVGYEVNKNLTLELGYRYLNLGDARSGRLNNAVVAESYAPLKIKDMDSHDFKIGMRWNFGDPDCCAPPTPPVAYAPPPVVRKF